MEDGKHTEEFGSKTASRDAVTAHPRIEAISDSRSGERNPSDSPGFSLHPLSIVKAIWNRKFVWLSIWIVVSAITFFVVRKLPAVYRAETAILVESQRIPEKFVSATVNPDLQDR